MGITRFRTSEELIVPYSPEVVWGVLADVAAYPDWWPANLPVKILRHSGELLGSEVEVRPLVGRRFRFRFEELEGRSMRLRFFRGALEGPGGFHLYPQKGGTRVLYEIDVFTRGLHMAVLSMVVSFERIHSARMRSVLLGLAARLEALGRAAERDAAEAMRLSDQEGALRKGREQAAAARLAAEERARKRAAEQQAARQAAEEAERRRAEKEAAARAVREEARRRAAEEEAARLAAEVREQGRKRAEEEAAARRAAEEAEQRAAEEEAARLAAEEEARKRAEEEAAARRAAEEAEQRAAEEEAARLAAEEEAARLAAEEAAARLAAAQSAPPDVAADGDHAERASDVPTRSRLRPLWGRIANWLGETPAPPPSDPEIASPRPSNFEIARFYLDALSSPATPEEIGQYFAPEATDEEFPHRFLEAAVARGFPEIVEARARALRRFGSQRYELKGATGGGSQVAMEVRWNGSVATTGEGFTEGQELEARIAIFLKFADGKIVRQRTYACFEPWSTKAERMLILDERVAQAGQSMTPFLPGPGPAPMPPPGSNFEIARRYLAALEAHADAEAIARFYAQEAVQDEFPNRFLPTGAHRDLQAVKLARSRGLDLMASESYELLGATGGGSMVALEVGWSGVVGREMGLFGAGQKLEARLAIFLKFRDGLIVAQRNYQQ